MFQSFAARRLGQVLIGFLALAALLFVEHQLNARFSALQPMRPIVPNKTAERIVAPEPTMEERVGDAQGVSTEAGMVRTSGGHEASFSATTWAF